MWPVPCRVIAAAAARASTIGARRLTSNSRRAAHAADTRRALITAARRLFSRRGYAGTSLDEVCERARVTKGALYHHFQNKEDLFIAVLEEVEADFVRAGTAAVSPRERCLGGIEGRRERVPRRLRSRRHPPHRHRGARHPRVGAVPRGRERARARLAAVESGAGGRRGCLGVGRARRPCTAAGRHLQRGRHDRGRREGSRRRPPIPQPRA